MFLGLNGLEVNTDGDAVVELMIDIAVARLTLDQIAERLHACWWGARP